VGRPSNTARRREELVGGLLRVMAARGYGGATIAEIAREAGLPPGVVHYHFESKKEILVAVLERLSGILRERYRRRAARAGRSESRGRVFAWVDAHVALGADADPKAMACWVAIGTEALRDPVVRAEFERVLVDDRRTLEALLRDALKAERRSPGAARAIASILVAAVQGAFQLGGAAPGAIAPGSMAPLLRRTAAGLLDLEPRRR
jgi:TetR/AcrR family transcriptional regulator, transcriptional repressor of bet genes